MKDINKVPIIDLHPAIQGEGQLAGVSHILIRTSGCNLKCMFENSICDTEYSSFKPEMGQYTIRDVDVLVQKNPQIEHIMITGGEPMLYPHFIRAIREIYSDHVITVETNGTMKVSRETLDSIDLISISPKLSSSTPSKEKAKRLKIDYPSHEQHESLRENIDVLVDYILNVRFSQLKYVISKEEDFREVEEQLKKIKGALPSSFVLSNRMVYLMPEGDTEEKLKKNRLMVADYCIKSGYSYTDRLQFIIYGNKRDA